MNSSIKGVADVVENEVELKLERELQMKIFSSLDFSSFASNKADLEEQFAEKNPSKKLKRSDGEPVKAFAQKEYKRIENKKEGAQIKERPVVKKSAKVQPAVSSNWMKFLATQKDEPKDSNTSDYKKNTNKQASTASNAP